MATEIGEVGAESIQRTSGGGGWLEQRSRAVQGVRSGWIHNLVHNWVRVMNKEPVIPNSFS